MILTVEKSFIILGWISILFHIKAFYIDDRMKMLIYNIVSTLLIGLSMIPYGGYTGAAISLFSVASKIVGIQENFFLSNIVKTIIGIFVGIIYFYFFSNENIRGLLPSASLFFIVMADLQKDILKMKLWYYGSAFCWILYAVIIMSPIAIVYDIIGVSVLTYSIYKIKKNRD
jgi:hypothetical protein